MTRDLLHLLRRASARDLLCLARELAALRPLPRTPEPTMAMDDRQQVRDYAGVGGAGHGMTAHYWLHALQAAHRLARCRRVVDLCCGPAVQLALVAELLPDCEFVGVDLSHEMLAMAERHARARGLANLRLVHADATRLPFPAGWADGVMSTVALHHLPDQAGLRACLAEGRRVAGAHAAWYVVDLLRPRSAANVPWLSRRDHPGAPAAFVADFEHSWRAAFSVADWAQAAAALPGCRLAVTRPAPLFAVLATAPGPVPAATARAAAAGIVSVKGQRYATGSQRANAYSIDWDGVRQVLFPSRGRAADPAATG
ncbi:MAG: class I SAM-dependent methyltransferase, partial [Planctomycetes bacterium]|nr:class I SAM-dependent methyltransferase [Planctomycetota bacterium]